jgi:hypothetical protein
MVDPPRRAAEMGIRWPAVRNACAAPCAAPKPIGRSRAREPPIAVDDTMVYGADWAAWAQGPKVWVQAMPK